MCKSVWRLEMLVCCMSVDQHVHQASVYISKPWFAVFKMQKDQFQNVFIKHKPHIFFSAYKDAIKLVLLNWN